MKKPLFFVLSIPAIVVLLLSCGDNATSPDLKTDIAGKWLVTRTLVTPNPDFPNGYQDQQEWTIAVQGETAALTTVAGTINGAWTSSDNFSYKHWVFTYEGPDPRTGTQIKLVVELISAGPLKGTNETYYWDPFASRFLLAESFSCIGQKI